MKILMVCLGNICRSPMAEGILRQKIQEQGLDWLVDSAGTGGWQTGQTPHHLAQEIALLHGIDISDLHARPFVQEDILHFDKIYVMDEENYLDVQRITAELWDASKVDFIMNFIYPGKNLRVPDPWYANNDEAFERTYRLLNTACDEIVKSKSSI